MGPLVVRDGAQDRVAQVGTVGEPLRGVGGGLAAPGIPGEEGPQQRLGE